MILGLRCEGIHSGHYPHQDIIYSNLDSRIDVELVQLEDAADVHKDRGRGNFIARSLEHLGFPWRIGKLIKSSGEVRLYIS